MLFVALIKENAVSSWNHLELMRMNKILTEFSRIFGRDRETSALSAKFIQGARRTSCTPTTRQRGRNFAGGARLACHVGHFEHWDHNRKHNRSDGDTHDDDDDGAHQAGDAF
ncbi:hypothetical protein D3C87_1236120 [compost metagenome]